MFQASRGLTSIDYCVMWNLFSTLCYLFLSPQRAGFGNPQVASHPNFQPQLVQVLYWVIQDAYHPALAVSARRYGCNSAAISTGSHETKRSITPHMFWGILQAHLTGRNDELDCAGLCHAL